jgi:hypothetical protein
MFFHIFFPEEHSENLQFYSPRDNQSFPAVKMIETLASVPLAHKKEQEKCPDNAKVNLTESLTISIAAIPCLVRFYYNPEKIRDLLVFGNNLFPSQDNEITLHC